MTNPKFLMLIFAFIILACSVNAFNQKGVVYDLSKYESQLNAVHPWLLFNNYVERVSSISLAPNDYVAKVSSFIKSRCSAPFCRHVLIVGDDFIVPHNRVTYVDYSKTNFLIKEEYTVLSDRAYISSTKKNVSDT